MRALKFVAPGRFEIQNVPAPSPGAGEVLIAPRYVGICATDLELLEGTHPYFERGVARYPLQPGHEWSGVVIESADPSFPPGTPVVANPEVSCGRPSCELCRSGHVPWCPDRQEIGCRGGLDGGAAEAIVLPSRNLYAIPPGVDLPAAVLAEPAVTVLGGMYRVGDVRGKRVLVIGAGTIGLIAAQVLTAAGAMVDVAVRNSNRGEALSDVGMVIIRDARKDPLPEAYPIVMSAAGTPEAVHLGLRALGNGGQLALLGVPGERVDQVDIPTVLHKDATIHGVLNYSGGGPGQFEKALQYVASGVIRGRSIIDSVYGLSEVSRAFGRVADGTRPRPKVLLEIREN